MTRPDLALCIGFAWLLSACTHLASPHPAPRVSLPLHLAWMDGRQVEYITTDISDPSIAQELGVKLVPRLAQALADAGRPSLVEGVYKFTDDKQITVFQSAPAPTGPR